jgi:AmmeMemoRadiSam system protein B
MLLAAIAAAPVSRPSAQAVTSQPQGSPPSLEQVRQAMGIASVGIDLRGQQDAVGFASTPEQMARVWDLSSSPPAPERLGIFPRGETAALIAPHDDYLYAGRVYRAVTPLVQARTVVLIGVFHRYRKFGMHDRLVFDPYRAWRTPDGEAKVSPLREELITALSRDDYAVDAAMHDSEHSLEALLFWLHHIRRDLEIVPVIVPAAKFERLEELARLLGKALAASMKRRGWQIGRDVAVVISTDGVHYGPDFNYVPFGDGGIEAYREAVAQDVRLLRGSLSGRIDSRKLRRLYETFVDPADPDRFRLTWCGRFSVPFGLLFASGAVAELGQQALVGRPLAYGTSVGFPELPVRDIGLGPTAPANLYHFVGYPTAAFVLEP